ncbi:MAG: hypothetical protein DRI65_14595 [Chloroflexota bacterium]|nr:MAG: hypothetical protein DRI65_14595 [Chloroflexota bacterium]
MTDFLIAYVSTTGEIISVTASPITNDVGDEFAGMVVSLAGDEMEPDDYYVDLDTMDVEMRLPFPHMAFESVPATSGFVIDVQGIPLNTTVHWPDDYVSVEDDGELQCNVNVPGAYTLHFENVKYKHKEVTVDVG